MVESRTVNALVAGSSPALGAKVVNLRLIDCHQSEIDNWLDNRVRLADQK